MKIIKEHKDFISIDGNDELYPEKFGFKKISLSDLFDLYKDEEFIPYAQYLRTHEWYSKRMEILDRDNFRCKNCGGYETKNVKTKILTENGTVEKKYIDWVDTEAIIWTDINGKERSSKLHKPQGKPDKSYNLQVHHKNYIINKLPWEYDNGDLVTLCNHCHLEIHENEDIPIYNENGHLILDYINCDRCGGTGYFPEYKHVENGICFQCRGARFNVALLDKKAKSSEEKGTQLFKSKLLQEIKFIEKRIFRIIPIDDNSFVTLSDGQEETIILKADEVNDPLNIVKSVIIEWWHINSRDYSISNFHISTNTEFPQTDWYVLQSSAQCCYIPSEDILLIVVRFHLAQPFQDTGGPEKYVSYWLCNKTKRILKKEELKYAIYNLKLSPNEKLLYGISNNGLVIFDVNSKSIVDEKELNYQHNIFYDEDTNRFITTYSNIYPYDKNVTIYNGDNLEIIDQFPAYINQKGEKNLTGSEISDLAYDSNSKMLAIASDKYKTISIINMSSMCLHKSINISKYESSYIPLNIKYSPDYKYLLLSLRQEIHLYEVNTFNKIASFINRPSDKVNKVKEDGYIMDSVFLGNGRTIVESTSKGSIRIWQ